MAQPLSAAAMHFGQAMCPPGDTDCVFKVGQAWERDIEAKFGVLASQPPQVERYSLRGVSGDEIGTLTYVDGTVTLCYKAQQKNHCGVVGNGKEAFDTALAMLSLQGVSVAPLA